MNSHKLRCVLSHDPVIKKNFVGVFVMDEFKENVKQNVPIEDNSLFIVNSENYTKSGEHWLLLYVKHKQVYFVDSFGKDPKLYKFVNTFYEIRNKIEFLNQIQLQSSFSSLCGEYCVFFAFNLCHKKSLREVLSNFSMIDFSRNDESIKIFMNKTFPGHERDSYYNML